MGLLAVLAASYSHLLALKFDRKVSGCLKRPRGGFAPNVCVVMACKGNEANLTENIEAILSQSYSTYRTVIVTDSIQDPAYSVAKSVIDRHSLQNVRLCTSDSFPQASGKVAALLTALDRDGWVSDAYAFVDSDALTPARWLSDMVGPLEDASVGATTGFRWYFPARGGFWSHVESAWNAAGTNVMFDDRYNFPWGGAMCVLSRTLKAINIRNEWKNAISDDLSLNVLLRKGNYRTVFLPQCIVATYNQTKMRDFLRWATRQVALTRVFNRRLWRYGLAAYLFFAVVMVLGILSVVELSLSIAWLLPAALLLSPSILGVVRSNERLKTFERAAPEFAAEFERNRWAHSMTSLIVPWIMTYCILMSSRVQEIEWRGRKYKLAGESKLAST
jgi:cellulose synthase/poly-beta-1,6-N-acetylglucosamine synthase-like glycosyltransferase